MRYFFIYITTFFLFLTQLANIVSAETILGTLKSDIQNSFENIYNGRSDWVQTPFGQFRLISCRTGVQDISYLSMAIEADIKPDWTLKTPVFQTNLSADWTATPLIPLKNDTLPDESWQDNYKNMTFFPFLLQGTSGQDVSVTIQGTWTACSETDGCLTQKTNHTLFLKGNENYATVWCGAVSQAMKVGAVPLDKTDLVVENTLLSTDKLKIRLTFPKTVSFLDIQSIDDYHLTPLIIQNEGQQVTLILKTDNKTPIKTGDTISFFIRSSLGNYQVQQILKDSPLPPPTPKALSLWYIFWTGLFFLLFSPIWSLFFKPIYFGTQSKTCIQQVRKIKKYTLGGILFLLLLWIIGFDPTNWTNITPVVWLWLMTSLILTIRPCPPNMWMILLLVAFLPKPFWFSLDNISLTTKIWMSLWWLCCLLFPLNILTSFPKEMLRFFKRKQIQSNLSYQIIVRFPYILTACWMILILCIPIWSPKPPIIPKQPTYPAIIQVMPETCFSCALDRRFLTIPKVPIYRIKSNTPTAWTKQRQFGIHQDIFSFLVLQDGTEFILPQELTTSKIRQILKKLSFE